MVMLADSCSFLSLILCIFRISNPHFINTGPTQSCASINIYKIDRQADIKRQIERKSNSIYMARGVFVLIYTFRLSVFLSVCISYLSLSAPVKLFTESYPSRLMIPVHLICPKICQISCYRVFFTKLIQISLYLYISIRVSLSIHPSIHPSIHHESMHAYMHSCIQ